MMLSILAGGIDIFSLVQNGNFQNIFLSLRVPRVVGAAFAGAALSVAGVTMQGLLKNPLADGSTIGISSGASLGAITGLILINSLGLITGVLGNVIIFVCSVCFSLLSFFLVLFISNKIDKYISNITIILIGIVFSMFVTAIVNFLIAMFPESAKTVTFWTMGSFTGTTYFQCFLIGIVILIALIVLLKLSTELDLLSLGEAQAQNLGVNVKITKIVLMFIASLLVGVSVAIAGVIAFVGLIVPHICRLMVGPKHKVLIISSSLFGASFLMLADLFSRIVIVPKELPIGILTSVIGAIVFVMIIVKKLQR